MTYQKNKFSLRQVTKIILSYTLLSVFFSQFVTSANAHTNSLYLLNFNFSNRMTNEICASQCNKILIVSIFCCLVTNFRPLHLSQLSPNTFEA